jgi:orotate phosphoribosyltransferase
MTKEDLGRAIYECSHITGEFLLRSGRTSTEYFDKYQFEGRPKILKEIAAKMAYKLTSDFDLLAGLEMGGIPIATALSLQSGNPVIFVRKKAKEYGTCKFAEGHEIKGKKLLIIEDDITSGGQVVISVNELRSEGAIIDTALCVIDRESGGKELLEANGIKLYPLFTMSELKSMMDSHGI